MPVFFCERVALDSASVEQFVQIIGQRTICDVLLVEIRFDLGTVKQSVKQLFGQMLFGGVCHVALLLLCRVILMFQRSETRPAKRRRKIQLATDAGPCRHPEN